MTIMLTNNEIIEAKSFRERLLAHRYLSPILGNDMWNVKYSSYNGTEKWDMKWDEPIWFSNMLDDFEEIIAEIKVRNYSMSAYDTWYIEKDKYQYLMNQTDSVKLYINFHPDGIQIWDLSKCKEPIWTEHLLPSNNQTEETKIKIKGDLKSSDSIQHKMDIPIHKILDESISILKKRKQNGK